MTACPLNLITHKGQIVEYVGDSQTGFKARFLYTDQPLTVDDELRQAIELDVEKRKQKDSHA